MLELHPVTGPMDYWLLLALVYTIGFAALVFESGEKNETPTRLALCAGLALLAFSLLCELVLGFEFQDWAVRGFYWARVAVGLAWLGHGFMLKAWPSNPNLQRGTWVLVGASLLALALVIFAPVTRAEDWFVPSQPIYGQLSDLLATNRPLRWGALALNIYGAAAIAIHAVLTLRRAERDRLRALCAVAGTALLLAPVYWPPRSADPAFFFTEAIAPILLFLAIDSAAPHGVTKAGAPRKPERSAKHARV